MIDPRKGLPSASSAYADSLCPGRHLAQLWLPDVSDSNAAHGTGVHRALETGDMTGLTPDQVETFVAAKEVETAVLEAWLDGEKAVKYAEHRFWAFRDDLTPTNSGQIDSFWMVKNRRALIQDVKSLFGDHQSADSNMQLRDEAVLLWLHFDVADITCFINQPMRTRKPVLVRYLESDLTQAYAEMRARVARSMDPQSPRIPGPVQCKYCRAAGTSRCPESTAVLQTLAVATVDQRQEVIPTDLLVAWLDKCGPAESVIAKLRAEAVRRLTDGEQVPGWKLEEGDYRRKVTDAREAYVKLADVLKPEQFADCVTVKISDLETAYRKVRGIKVKEAREEFETRLSGLIERKQNKPSLARV